MTNLDKSLNNYITHIKFLNLDAVNYYFITKCHKNYIKNKKSKSIKKSINLIINNEKINSDLLIYFNPYYFSPINYLLKYIHTESCIGIGNEEYQNYFQLYFIINEDQEIDTIFDTLNKFK